MGKDIEPVTVIAPGVPVVFNEFMPGVWSCCIWPGPTGFGSSPVEALTEAMRAWPDAFAWALKKRGGNTDAE